MREICIWLVGIVMLTFGVWYAWLVKQGKAKPTLSTWVIFQIGTLLSFATYMLAENHDFRTGIQNAMDVVGVAISLGAILAWRKQRLLFKPFEKKYLWGVAIILSYGIATGDAWGSNVFTQILICIGYFPTIQTLVTEKRNQEPFTGWIFGIIASVIALYPSFVDGNALAALYSVRTIVMISVMMSIMGYYTKWPGGRRSKGS